MAQLIIKLWRRNPNTWLSMNKLPTRHKVLIITTCLTFERSISWPFLQILLFLFLYLKSLTFLLSCLLSLYSSSLAFFFHLFFSLFLFFLLLFFFFFFCFYYPSFLCFSLHYFLHSSKYLIIFTSPILQLISELW